ncbi:MAG: hypothetical protein ACE15F_12700 [bacterium]
MSAQNVSPCDDRFIRPVRALIHFQGAGTGFQPGWGKGSASFSRIGRMKLENNSDKDVEIQKENMI